MLGDIFVKNYYLIFDFDSSKIGLNGFTVPYIAPINPDEEPKVSLWVVILIILLLAAIFIPVIVYYGCYKKKRERYESNVSQLFDSYKYDQIPKNVNQS